MNNLGSFTPLALGISFFLTACLSAYSFTLAQYGYVLNLISLIALFLLCELQKDSLRRLLSGVSIFSLAFFGLGLGFIFNTLQNAGLPFPISLLAWGCPVLFCSAFNLIFALIFYFTRTWAISTRLCALPFFWVLLESLRHWVFTGFPMLLMGYAQLDWPLIHYAPVGGVLLCSGMIVSMALCFVWGGLYKRPIYLWQLPLLILLLGYGLSFIRWSQEEAARIKVAGLQTGQSFHERFTDTNYSDQWFRLKKLLDQVSTDVDLAITPEGLSLLLFEDLPAEFWAMLREWTNTHPKTDVAIGTFFAHYPAWEGWAISSAVILPHEQLSAPQPQYDPNTRYEKRNLIPFAEFIPRWYRWLNIGGALLPMSNGRHGEDKKVQWHINNVTLSPSLCYEFFFGSDIRPNAVGADALVNMAFDSWFVGTWEIQQSLQIAKMRAVEAARPVIKVDSWGISGVIDAKGKEVLTLPEASPEVFETYVHRYSGITPYYQYGLIIPLGVYLFPWLLLIIYRRCWPDNTDALHIAQARTTRTVYPPLE